MAALDIIEFFDDSGEIIVAKFPQVGSGEFRLGSQLVVQESQVAVFFRDGQALDGFRPGRHTLATQNLPLLAKIIGLPFGKSPFRCYVYFLATKTFINLGWGTASPVMFPDTNLRMVTIRAHGTFSIRITKVRTFLQTLVGTRGLETTYAIEEFFRSIIVSRFNEVVGTSMKSILDLPTQYNKIALDVKKAVKDDFEQYGIALVDLLVEAITVPPDVQEMINRATGVAAQDVPKYQAIAKADALRDAAKNPGAAGGAMGAGLGLGMGIGLGKELADQVASKTDPVHAPSSGVPMAFEDTRTRLRNLKQLKDEGLITDVDFEEQKRRILGEV